MLVMKNVGTTLLHLLSIFCNHAGYTAPVTVLCACVPRAPQGKVVEVLEMIVNVQR